MTARIEMLPCMCLTLEEHREGVAIQRQMRARYRFAKRECVGCTIGDDGPSVHSCAIHPERYWPKETR